MYKFLSPLIVLVPQDLNLTLYAQVSSKTSMSNAIFYNLESGSNRTSKRFFRKST